MTQVFYAWLDGGNKIVGAGMSPDRETYDFLTAQAQSSMPDAELIETGTNLTYSINHTYDRDTGETTPPDPPARPALLEVSPAPTTMEDLIIALDEKDNGDPSKWQDLLTQARSSTSSGQPS
jgi:hypothetical protein